MVRYETPVQVLADAKQRVRGLGPGNGIIIVEGGDDRRVMRHGVDLERIVVAGSKWIVLECWELSGTGQSNMVFMVDCDYDVPTGRLRPGRNLIVSGGSDVECDLVAAGALRDVVGELVPRAHDSEAALVSAVDYIRDEAVALAETIGRLRFVSTRDELCLKFDGLEIGSFRDRNCGAVDRSRVLSTVRQRSRAWNVSNDDLQQRVESIDGGLRVCCGHDLIAAIQTVLRQQYSLSGSSDPSGVRGVAEVVWWGQGPWLSL